MWVVSIPSQMFGGPGRTSAPPRSETHSLRTHSNHHPHYDYRDLSEGHMKINRRAFVDCAALKHRCFASVHGSPWQRISTLARRVRCHYNTVINGLCFSLNTRGHLFCCTSFWRRSRHAAIVFKQACGRSQRCVVPSSPGMDGEKCSLT